MRSELSEQAQVVRELTRAGIVFFAVPNGAKRNRQEQARARLEGIQRGVPDLVLPLPPPGVAPAVLEMKRAVGGRVSKEQRVWLERFAAGGWTAIVANGAQEALEALAAAGWGVRVPGGPGEPPGAAPASG